MIEEKESGGAICVAFPQGIPLEIWCNHVEHEEEYPGDKGIRFEEKDGPYRVFN